MKLIINADDFGLTKGTNKAIIELAHLKTLSSTTVMVNMPYASEVSAVSVVDGFGIGLHFNLTQGMPISSKKDIHSLVDKDGYFYHINIFKERIKSNLVNKSHVIKELSAQHDRLIGLIGNRMSHIDSHQDINKIGLINEAIHSFVNKRNLKMGLRWYNKSYLVKLDNSYRILNPSIVNVLMFGWRRSLTETYFRAKRKRFKQSFVLPNGMLYAQNNSTRTLLKLIVSGIPYMDMDKVYEIMCHPASDASGLSEVETPAYRIEEYEILRSVEFKEFVKKNKLISFTDLY